MSEIAGAFSMSGLYLAVAILSEVIGTMNIKLCHGFTRWQPALLVLVCYGLSTFCLSLAVKKMDISVAYAIWCAVGTALIAAIGVVWFKESINTVKIVSLCLIVAGVVGLNLAKAGP
jgi:small multidrug resistance pump